MPLGTEVDLGPGDVVLDGVTPSSHLNGAQPPVFGPCLLWPNMVKTPLGMEVDLSPGHIVLDRDPVPLPPTNGAQ